MLTVTATIGIPRSGKSSYAREQMQRNPDLRKVNRDDIRELIAHESIHNTNPFENEVSQVQHYLIVRHLKNGHDVIIDNTNVKPERLNDIRKSILEYCNERQQPVLFQTKLFDTDVDECVRRNDECRKRGERFVLLNIIQAMSSALSKNISKGTIKEFKEVIHPSQRVENRDGLPYAVICDIDGTVADISQRNPYDTAQCLSDTPKDEIIQIVNLLSKFSHIIFVSGREEQYRDLTELWLEEHGLVYSELHMRKVGDTRKDSIIKEEILERLILPKYNIRCILDDRNQVVRMYRDKGLTVLQVDWGDF